jgi:hypothetical protein
MVVYRNKLQKYIEGIVLCPPRQRMERISIKFHDFASRRMHNIADTEGAALLGLAASPNGNNLVFSRRESDNDDLILLDLF